MGCQGVEVPLTGRHVAPSGVVHPLWSAPSTQLSHLWLQATVACAAATPRQTASTGGLNQVRVAVRSETLGELGNVYPSM